MKKIISISIEETILKQIDESRGIATRSKFIETILIESQTRSWNQWSFTNWQNPKTDDPIEGHSKKG